MTKSVPAGQGERHPDDEANARRDKGVPTQQSGNIRRAGAEREANRALLPSLIGCPSTSRVESRQAQEHRRRTEQLSTASPEYFGRQ